jgi:hypothetical protein
MPQYYNMAAENWNSEKSRDGLARQWCCKQVSTATNQHTTEELLEMVFSMQSMLRLYSGDQWEKLVVGAEAV